VNYQSSSTVLAKMGLNDGLEQALSIQVQQKKPTASMGAR
jgi:hypothetical protein